MSNVMEDMEPDPKWDFQTPLSRPAANADERRFTLKWCLGEPWANADIGRLERVDTEHDHGWIMWRWIQQPPPSATPSSQTPSNP